MKQIVRQQILLIPKKLRVEVRINVDDKPSESRYQSENGTITTSISLFPTVTLAIIRQSEIDEFGNKSRQPWNPNDSILANKFSYPILLNELKSIYDGFKIPELYSYTGDTLELNNEIAESIRKVFMISKDTIELSAVILSSNDINDNEIRSEGLKLKINNEQSTVCLTINELESLIYTMDKLDIDVIGNLLYTGYIMRPGNVINEGRSTNVDIRPI